MYPLPARRPRGRSRRRGRLVALLAAPVLALPLLGAAAADAAPAAAASPYQRPGETERVSVAFDGIEGNNNSYGPDMTADGRFVAFSSGASNLVPGDTNDVDDVFVFDRASGILERVSVASDGAQGESEYGSYVPSISADGRYVKFHSSASNLVPGDTNGVAEEFVHDRETGVTERVSVASDGTEADDSSGGLGISADGRYVVIVSGATNLVPGDTNGETDAFVHDRETGTTERVSVASDGTEGDDNSGGSGISADGRYVLINSDATNLVPGDTNGRDVYGRDVFVHDRETGVTERVSVASDGTQANAMSVSSEISGDGRFVAFTSYASNLVPADTNGRPDVFVHDRETGRTERVSVTSDGTEFANVPWGSSYVGAISGDGRYVTFFTSTPYWVAFVHDRATGTTEQVSVASDGTPGSGGREGEFTTAVSADGRFVALHGDSSNLVPGDTNNGDPDLGLDVFVRDRGPAAGVGGLTVRGRSNELAVAGWATFSGATVTAAADDPADGGGVAADVGAEIVAGSAVVRPEATDLLLRLELASLPGEGVCVRTTCSSTGAAGAPGVVYRWRLTAGETTYEVRAMGTAAVPYFALYECDLVCTETELLSGSIGTTGAEVRVAVPLASLGVDEQTPLTGVAVSTGLGEAATEPLTGLDDLALPDASIPVPRVELGIAPPSASRAEVDFTTVAELVAGRFSGTFDASSLPPGDQRVWARACLGETCGAHWAPVPR